MQDQQGSTGVWYTPEDDPEPPLVSPYTTRLRGRLLNNGRTDQDKLYDKVRSSRRGPAVAARSAFLNMMVRYGPKLAWVDLVKDQLMAVILLGGANPFMGKTPWDPPDPFRGLDVKFSECTENIDLFINHIEKWLKGEIRHAATQRVGNMPLDDVKRIKADAEKNAAALVDALRSAVPKANALAAAAHKKELARK